MLWGKRAVNLKEALRMFAATQASLLRKPVLSRSGGKGLGVSVGPGGAAGELCSRVHPACSRHPCVDVGLGPLLITPWISQVLGGEAAVPER